MSCSIKVGRELYEVLEDGESGNCELKVWIVRTVRGGKITAIQKNEWTWVKLSKSHGDWGWAKYIWPLWRKTWRAEAPIPDSLATTKKGAWRKLLNAARDGTLYIDSSEVVSKIISTATRMVKSA